MHGPGAGSPMRYVLTILALLLVVGGLAFVKFSQISMLIGMGEAMAQAGPPPEAVSTTPATLATWEASLRAVGNRELADVYQRAIREFQTGAARGLFGTAGVNHSDVRK